MIPPISYFKTINASCHRSKEAKDFLYQNGNSRIKTINSPANSPDFNLIENVWNRNMEKRRPTYMDELRLAMRKSWGKFHQL